MLIITAIDLQYFADVVIFTDVITDLLTQGL